MNKQLKFAKDLVPLVIDGKKTSTWRLWDDKDLSDGDVLDLVEFGEKTPFAIAQITKVIEKPLGQLTVEDKKGHEVFKSDEEMYKTYEKYYKRPVSPQTVVKIIWFHLIP